MQKTTINPHSINFRLLTNITLYDRVHDMRVCRNKVRWSVGVMGEDGRRRLEDMDNSTVVKCLTPHGRTCSHSSKGDLALTRNVSASLIPKSISPPRGNHKKRCCQRAQFIRLLGSLFSPLS